MNSLVKEGLCGFSSVEMEQLKNEELLTCVNTHVLCLGVCIFKWKLLHARKPATQLHNNLSENAELVKKALQKPNNNTVSALVLILLHGYMAILFETDLLYSVSSSIYGYMTIWRCNLAGRRVWWRKKTSTKWTISKLNTPDVILENLYNPWLTCKIVLWAISPLIRAWWNSHQVVWDKYKLLYCLKSFGHQPQGLRCTGNAQGWMTMKLEMKPRQNLGESTFFNGCLHPCLPWFTLCFGDYFA